MRTLRRSTAAVTASVIAVSLTACGNGAPFATIDTPLQPGANEAKEAQAEGPNAEEYDLYNEALDGLNLDGNRFNDRNQAAPLYEPTGEFEYALVDVNGDGVPELLVSAIASVFNISKVFTVTDGELIETSQLFADGAASAGGSRAEFHTSAENNGVFKTLGTSGTGEYQTSRWTLEGSAMVEGESWDYRIDRKPAELGEEQAEIDWTPSDDRSPLGGDDASQSAAAHSDGQNSNRPTPSAGDAEETPTAASGNLPQSDLASPEQTDTTCGTVDGVTVTAGSATSCGFAMNVAQQALQPGTWGPGVAPDPSVTPPWGSRTVTASSPATGETYTLRCSSGTAGDFARCTGGNNAEVQFRNERGSLMYLLG